MNNIIKIKCVGLNSNENNFTLNKVYEFKDGVVINDKGFSYGEYKSVENFISWLSLWYTFEIVEDKKQFTLDDLKSGMLVKRRCESKLLMVLKINESKFLVDNKLSTVTNLSEAYNNNLTNKSDKTRDIVEVYKSIAPKIGRIENTFFNNRELLWKEEEPKVDWNKVEPMTLVKCFDYDEECVYGYLKKYHKGEKEPFELYFVDKTIDELNGYEGEFFKGCELINEGELND